MARALILAGANVCSRGGGNSTPLHFAAWGGNKKVVRLLLDYGGDVEARDTEGNAPQVRRRKTFHDVQVAPESSRHFYLRMEFLRSSCWVI